MKPLSSEAYPDQVYVGTYLIIKCWKRQDGQYVHSPGGWYRIFGPGGFWNVPLLDSLAGNTHATPPYYPGQALVRARLRPPSEPITIRKRIAHLETFEPLIPRAASRVTLAEL